MQLPSEARSEARPPPKGDFHDDRRRSDWADDRGRSKWADDNSPGGPP